MSEGEAERHAIHTTDGQGAHHLSTSAAASPAGSLRDIPSRSRSGAIGLDGAGHGRMSALAAIPDDTVTIPVKTKRIPKRIQQAIALIGRKGITQREAAKQVGMSEFHLSRVLKQPQIQVFIARSARQNIQLGVLRASNRVMELVDAASEHVSLDASKHVLAIEGIKPTADAQVSVNIDIKAGYVIDLTDSAKPVTDARLTQGPVIDHE